MDASIGQRCAASWIMPSAERRISQLLDAAKARFEEEEDPLAFRSCRKLCRSSRTTPPLSL